MKTGEPTQLQSYKATKLQSYRATKLQSYNATKLQSQPRSQTKGPLSAGHPHDIRGPTLIVQHKPMWRLRIEGQILWPHQREAKVLEGIYGCFYFVCLCNPFTQHTMDFVAFF